MKSKGLTRIFSLLMAWVMLTGVWLGQPQPAAAGSTTYLISATKLDAGGCLYEVTTLQGQHVISATTIYHCPDWEVITVSFSVLKSVPDGTLVLEVGKDGMIKEYNEKAFLVPTAIQLDGKLDLLFFEPIDVTALERQVQETVNLGGEILGKEDISSIQPDVEINPEVAEGMLVFKSVDELYAMSEKLSKSDRAEADKWEAEIGFVSQRNIFDQIIDAELELDKQYEQIQNASKGYENSPRHSDLYYKYLKSNLIKIVEEGTDSEYYDYSIPFPPLANVLNSDGLVSVNGIVYQFTDGQSKTMDADFSKLPLLLRATETDPKENIQVTPYSEFQLKQSLNPSSGWVYSSDHKKRMQITLAFSSSQFFSNGTQWKVTNDIHVQYQKKNFWGNWEYTWELGWVAGDWSLGWRLENPNNLSTMFDYSSAAYAYQNHSTSISNFWASISPYTGNSSPYPTTFYYQYLYNGQPIRILDITLDHYYWKTENSWGIRATIGSSSFPKCSMGGYDGANCYVGTPPFGTHAFMYAYKFYYTPVPSCPYPGSWYDGANCYVGTPPSGTTPFIYAGNWYYTPRPGHSCPYPGSWYDGANCYVGTPPSGTTPFIYAGNWYYTALPSHNCPYPGSWYDGANCFVANIPHNSMPFIYNNNWYVTTYR